MVLCFLVNVVLLRCNKYVIYDMRVCASTVSVLSGRQKLSDRCGTLFSCMTLATSAKPLIRLFTARRNACIASAAVLATAIPSVRPSVCLSVRHTPVLCQNDGT